MNWQLILHLDMKVITTRPREEWRQDVAKRYRALEQFSKEEARVQFLRILRSLPYGQSLAVICSSDPSMYHSWSWLDCHFDLMKAKGFCRHEQPVLVLEAG